MPEERNANLKAAREALEASERRYRELVDLAPIGIFRSTREGRFISVNRALASLLGYDSPDEMLQLDLRTDVYVDGAERDRRLSERESVGMSGFEVRWKRRDGSPVWVRLDSRVIRGDSGDIELFEGFVHDIQERKDAEEALRGSEERYRLLFEKNPEPMWVFDEDTLAFLAVNDTAIRTYGYSAEEFLSMTIKEIRPTEDVARLLEILSATRGSYADARDVRHRKKDGSLIDVEIASQPLEFSGRRARLILAKDVTERKRAEESLWESEQRYRTLFESMLHGYAYCEMLFENGEPRDFVYLDVNRAFEELTGLKDVVGKRVTDVIPGIRESNPELFQMYGRVALTGTPGNFEIHLRTLGIWLSISTYSPQKGHFVALFDNITERKRAEKEIRKSEERFRRLFDSNTIGITVANLSGQILESNDAYLAMVGYTREELLSGGVRWDAMTPAEHREKDQLAIEQLQRTGVAQPYEKELIRKDGTQVPLLIGIATLEASERSIIAYTIDLSARRLLEDQLRQAQKMEAIGQLAGGVAHDFNNLLTAILGYADLLASRLPSDSHLQEEIGEIRGAGQRAAALTRQLLAFSRKQILEPVVLRPNELVANLEKMLRRVIGEDVQLVTRLQPSVGNVRADPGQLEQVIVNLAVNARDAMPEGGKLTIETADADLDEAYAQRHVAVRPGRYVMVAVSDTGAGMNAETQVRIFEPFFTTKEKGKGTGLGLSTVYGIVKQSGGYIWLYSEPGGGTTFKVYLPRVEEAVSDTRRSSDSPPALGTETILVVEDEPAIRALSRRVLERSGYHVLEARDGESALELVRTHPEPIHLLLTDLVMPDMPGTELATRLCANHPGLRVVFMSGYTDDGVVRSGLLESGRAFLQKPFTPAILSRKIRDALA